MRLSAPKSIVVLLLLFVAPPGFASSSWYSDSQDKMGTRVSVQVWHDDQAEARQLLTAAMREFDRIESAMSTYRPDSEITRLNETAALRPVKVSAELFELIQRALDVSATTGGAFDITYDSVGQFYDYRAGRRPTGEQIGELIQLTGYELVELDPDTQQVHYLRDGVRINLGGIAKGFAVESVIGLLRDAGIRHAMAGAGGDTRLLGNRVDRPWMVGIRDPDEQSGIVTRLPLTDEAISTSGDYERFFIEDGVRYHHILNPATGQSASGLRSATVIGPDATMTDALSTSVFVLGADAGLALIERIDGYEAVIIGNDRQLRFSTGLAPP